MKKLEAAKLMTMKDLQGIPTHVIEKLYAEEPEELENVTPVTEGEYVDYDGFQCEVTAIDGDLVTVDLLGEEVTADAAELIRMDTPFFPMWGTMWHVTDSVFNRFIEENPQAVADCGFEIYVAPDFDGYLIGLNSAGYDFYEAHWVPLYDAQGLKWHDEEDEEEAK